MFSLRAQLPLGDIDRRALYSKEKKLDQKFKFLQSELPKYQSYLDELIKDETINEKQCENLQTQTVLSVESLTYDINDDAFWVFSEGETSFKKYNRSGIVIFEVTTEVAQLGNQPICLADGNVLFRKKRCLLTQLNINGEETVFLDCDCMYCPEENTGVVIGIVNSELLSKYDKHGHCTNEIKNPLLFKNLIVSKNTKCRATYSTYIAENTNGDICISHKDVDVFDKKGNFRFSYYGHRNTNLEFQPRGICTDTLGHILVADAGNHGVHVLDSNGNLQKLYDVPSKENDFQLITLTIDANYSLCIGCSDEKIRIFKYIE